MYFPLYHPLATFNLMTPHWFNCHVTPQTFENEQSQYAAEVFPDTDTVF